MGFFESLKGMSNESVQRRRQAAIESSRAYEESQNKRRQQELEEKRLWEENLALGYETFRRLDIVKKMADLQRTAQQTFGKAPKYRKSSDGFKSTGTYDDGRMLMKNGHIWIEVHAGSEYFTYRDTMSDSGGTNSDYRPKIQVRVEYTVHDQELGFSNYWGKKAHKPARDWTVEEFDSELLEQWPH